VKGGHESKPVVFVSFYDALRFANWLHNGEPVGSQNAGTTEDGAYTITPQGIAANSIVRNPGARAFVPNENEWFKAAYYDPGTETYWDYPMATNFLPTSSPPAGGPTSGNFWDVTYALTGSASFDDNFDYLTNVGAYTTAVSPYGTHDQGGNAWEWVDTVSNNPSNRTIRGGGFDDQTGYLAASVFTDSSPTNSYHDLTFRIAPEPGGAAAVAALAVAALRVRRSR
jgi:formylglycine-generating enzyme required for sulfatase activity